MPGENYCTEDFLLDEYFQRWVKHPNLENDTYWQEFLRRHPEARKSVAEAKTLILQLDFPTEPRSQATKDRIKSTIDNAIGENVSSKEIPRYPELSSPNEPLSSLTRKWVSIAATITGLILLSGIYFIFFPSSDYTEYTTDYGETETIVLPDQSIVTLNANSSLRIDKDGWDNQSERKVWLRGEAFFAVEKQKTPQGVPARFIVHSGKVQVEVLGTRFNVNSRRRETKVVLSAGKVKLNIQRDTQHDHKEVLMKPGELVAVRESKHEVEKRIVDPSQYTAWTENKLVFDKTPVAIIQQLIEDNYGLEVLIENPSLLSKEFTGAAPADDLDILLGKLSVVYNLTVTRRGNEILLEEK